MRLLAVRNKARDVRLLALGLIGLYALVDSRWDTSPLVENTLLATGVFLCSIAFVLRAWAVIYIAGNKTTRLIVEGPFSVCRNPIYLSTFLGAFGIALATATFSLPLLVLLVFGPYLHFQIKGEEAKLARRHGQRFATYCATTPRLIPNFALLDEPLVWEVQPAAFRVWLMDGLWFVWGLGIVEIIEGLHEAQHLPVLWWLF